MGKQEHLVWYCLSQEQDWGTQKLIPNQISLDFKKLPLFQKSAPTL